MPPFRRLWRLSDPVRWNLHHDHPSEWPVVLRTPYSALLSGYWRIVVNQKSLSQSTPDAGCETLLCTPYSVRDYDPLCSPSASENQYVMTAVTRDDRSIFDAWLLVFQSLLAEVTSGGHLSME